MDGVAEILSNCKKYLAAEYDVFLVADGGLRFCQGIAVAAADALAAKSIYPSFRRYGRVR